MNDLVLVEEFDQIWTKRLLFYNKDFPILVWENGEIKLGIQIPELYIEQLARWLESPAQREEKQ